MKSIFRIFLINIAIIFIIYAVAEAVYSSYLYRTSKQTIWVSEDSGRTVHYDPVKGFSLTQTPSRYLRIINGVFNSIGTLEGNAQGFPDRDDFTYARATPEQKRYGKECVPSPII
jgi:hypothetical protein